VLTLGTLTNWVAGGLLAFTIFFYAVIYTMWLKRSTPQNIVIGGAAGAFPPMIGWAAVTGTVSLESVILFLIIFLWTPPHFWALALFKLRDYDMAHVPMLPNVAGERHTKLQIVAYSVVLTGVAVLPWPLGFAGPGLRRSPFCSAEFPAPCLGGLAHGRRRRDHGPGQEAVRLLARLSRRAVLGAAGRSAGHGVWRGDGDVTTDQRRSNLTDAQKKAQRRRSIALGAGASRPSSLSSMSAHGRRWARRCSTGRCEMPMTGTDKATKVIAATAWSPRSVAWHGLRHGRHGLRIGAALPYVLPGDRLWRHDTARATAGIEGSGQDDQGAFRRQHRGVDWDFRPKQREVELKIGETAQVAYEAHNNVVATSTGTATFNVTPQAAGAYFNKIDCFCFTEQTLGGRRNRGHADRLLHRPGHRGLRGTQGHFDDHALLHLLSS
jgi:hypothetical protein